jgi:hypothetical protein
MTSYVPSPRLDRLITDPAERTYLESDEGYWADRVLKDFSFLESRGGVVDRIRFHQNGHYITYRGGWGTVTTELAPDVPSMTVSVQSDLLEIRGELETIARARVPGLQAPPPMGPDRESIAAAVSQWASMLETIVIATGGSGWARTQS